MAPSDVFLIIIWWIWLVVIGFIFLPVTTKIFNLFYDRGYIFSKILGLIFLSYSTFLLGILHISPFSRFTLFIVLLLTGIVIVLSEISIKKTVRIDTRFLKIISEKWKLFIFEEAIFLGGIFLWSYIRSYQPDIHGLEKFMDFGFVNSLLRTEYFPPKDMWFSPFSINYYYFGHLFTAVLIKLSQIPSSLGYNLMLASLFGLCFTCSFSIGTNLLYYNFSNLTNKKSRKIITTIFFGGILSGALVSLSGNLQVLYAFFSPYQNDNPLPFTALQFLLQSFPNSYWYPNATRFIHNTIHEFPIYSFVVSDLHGHVLGIPLILSIVAYGLHTIIKGKIIFQTILLFSFLLAIAYMTNAWDGIIYYVFTVLVITTVLLSHVQKHDLKTLVKPLIKKSLIQDTLRSSIAVLILFFLFSFPFSYFFKPFVSGIGILCAPLFLVQLGHIGPFLFEPAHCQKSPVWQLLVLYGFFYFFVFSFIFFISKTRKVTTTDIFVLLLIFLGSLLIIIPEFIYIKDIYPAHYRANTMFKLVYQSFILLSLATGYIIIRIYTFKTAITSFIGRLTHSYFTVITILLTGLVLLYPYFAISSYYEQLKKPFTLDGTEYLKRLYPSDYQAILWINKTVTNQPVILEAQGDSYTDYGRISANTGLLTVLGWTVHEWLWRGTYDVAVPRIQDVKILYESPNIETTKTLLRKYNISLVIIGDLERQKYPLLQERKFSALGKIIFSEENTKIYKVNEQTL